MRLLMISALIVIAAGAASVLLAVAAKAGLEATGIEVLGWRQTLTAGLSALAIIYLLGWRIRKNSSVPVGRSRGWTMAIPVTAFMVVMIFLVPLIVDPADNHWQWTLTLFGLLAAAFTWQHLWTARQASNAAANREVGTE